LVLGLGEAAQGLIVVVRVLGYALVLIALYKEMLAKREPPAGAKPR
jgi:hypothetical protein